MKKQIEILNHQILRLAKIYTSREVMSSTVNWHLRVLRLQTNCIREKRAPRTQFINSL